MKNILFLLLTTFSFSAFCQDAFLSNYPNNLLFYNPAYAGVDSTHSFSLSGRTQWDIYNSLVLTYDQPLNKIHSGIGGILIYENNGSLPIETYQSAGCYNYNFRFTNKMNLRVGMQAGFNYEMIHTDNLYFGYQFNGSGWDTTSSGNVSNMTHGYFDFGAGFFYKWGNLFAGFSVHHLATASVISSNGDEFVPAPNYIATAGFNFRFGKNIINTPSVLFMKQGTDTQYFQVSNDISFKQKVFIGAGFRGMESLDALVARAGFRIMNKIQLMFCYDYAITVPAFQTHGWNAYEANLKYMFR